MTSRILTNSLALLSVFSFAASAARADHYTVRGDENYTQIAHLLGVPLKTLKRANPDISEFRLRPGLKLQIPDGASDSPSETRRDPSEKASSKKRHRLESLREKKLEQLAEWKSYKKSLLKKKASLAKRESLRERKLDQLAEWKAYKKSLFKKKASLAKRESLRRKKLRQLAEWKAYKKALAARRSSKSKREMAQKINRARAAHEKRLALAEKRSRSKRDRESAGSKIAAQKMPFNSRLVRTALAYRGARYVYGADGGGQFDCSGFTRTVYRRALGVSLPHSSREQFGYGKRVSEGELKPGDLLFFGASHRGISHVGIYIGDGRFVHAANPRRGVTTDSLGGSYASKLVGARRIVRH